MKKSSGFSLLEMMIAVAIGLLLLSGVAAVYLAQRQMARASTAQFNTQNSSAVIESVLSPLLRVAGSAGCAWLPDAELVASPTKNMPGGFYGTETALAAASDFKDPVRGFDAVSSAEGNTLTLTGLDSTAIATNRNRWVSLGADVAYAVENTPPPFEVVKFMQGSDVVTMASQRPNSVAALAGTTTNEMAVSLIKMRILAVPVANSAWDGTIYGYHEYEINAVTDCVKTAIVPSGGSTYVLNGGIAQGLDWEITPQFSAKSQLMRLERTMFFVGMDKAGGRGALYMARKVRGTWISPQLIASGVNNMQALYGVDMGSKTLRYVSASSVSDWTKVRSVRLGFLLEGTTGSNTSTPQRNFTVLGTNVVVPADNRLRHVMEMTVNLRGAPSWEGE